MGASSGGWAWSLSEDSTLGRPEGWEEGREEGREGRVSHGCIQWWMGMESV